jgi:hypothetical protein
MKKVSFYLFLLIGISLFASCKKEAKDEVTTQVINVTLVADQNYTYTLPAVEKDSDPFSISKQAQNFIQSSITNNGSLIYQYTPAKGFVGTDQVTLQSMENEGLEHHDNDHKGTGMHGNCQGGNHQEQEGKIIIINFTINPTGTK